MTIRQKGVRGRTYSHSGPSTRDAARVLQSDLTTHRKLPKAGEQEVRCYAPENARCELHGAG